MRLGEKEVRCLHRNLAADMLGVAQGGQALTKPTLQQPIQNTTVK